MAENGETPAEVRAEIEHLRRLADSVTDHQVRDAIRKMIAELEQRLRDLEDRRPGADAGGQPGKPSPPGNPPVRPDPDWPPPIEEPPRPIPLPPVEPPPAPVNVAD
jgi:hypothetical protein